jgi:hypothetical protein
MVGDLETKIRALPPELQREVEDFVDFLTGKQSKRPADVPTFEWAGALEHLRSQYTSVSLQHAISEWWAGYQ